MIALIDYGAGNLRSVEKALRYVGARVKRVSRPDQVGRAKGMVLPGVGAFDDCLDALKRQKLRDTCREFIAAGKPFLGICVGYQALFDSSEEFNSKSPGLRILKGKVVRFSDRPGFKIPQIGWNQLEVLRPECPLLRGIPDGSYVYFVHSYYPRPEDESIVATMTRHSDTFASAIWVGNVFATQFHPEKSQEVGLTILRNFLALVK